MENSNESYIPPTPSSSGSSSTHQHHQKETTAPNSTRNYEFVVSASAQRPEGEDRSVIRRAVMRNFFDEKRRGSDAESSSENVSASTVMARPMLRSRLRLSRDGKELVETKKRRRKGVGEKVDAARRGSEAQDTGMGMGMGIEDSLSRMRIPERRDERDGGELLSPELQSPDVGLLPRTEELDALHSKGKWLCSGVNSDDSDWWFFVASDDAVYYAALANWALYATTLTGDHNFYIQAMKTKDAAIQNLNAKLSGRAGDVSDDLIGTVMLGANFENLLGAYDASELHIAALKRMVDVRGGLGALVHNDGLLKGMTWLKGVTWVDFHYATAHRQSPRFPRMHFDAQIPSLPGEFLEEAAREPPICFSGLSLCAAECHDIFYRIRRLALASSSHWSERLDRRSVYNLLYETEYLILSVPDLSQEFLSYDIGLSIIGQYTDNVDISRKRVLADDASVVEALVAASQIFIFAAVREVPPKATTFKILLERLKRALDREDVLQKALDLPDTTVAELWKRGHHLSVLLWILVVGYSVARHWEDRSWWVGQLAELVGELGVNGEEDWRRKLSKVAWIERYFKDVLKGIQADASTHLQELYEKIAPGNRTREKSRVTEDLMSQSTPDSAFDPSPH